MTAYEFFDWLDGQLWGTPLLVVVLGGGFFYMIASKFFVFRNFGHILKYTLFSVFQKDDASRKGAKGAMSAFQAVCVGIGGAVGTANVVGVATAIATGGPGALFWMILWGFFAMTIKMVEITFACYYRSRNEKGELFGGPSIYMQKAMGEERKWGWWVVTAWIFGIGLVLQCLSGNTTFTMAEALNNVFGIPMMPFAIGFSIFLLFVIWRGHNKIGEYASYVVPFMCTAYIIGALVIVVVNITVLPSVIVSIIKCAFTGHAAVGGFTGAVVAQTIRVGVARAVYSNEAGFGSTPHIHACADTVHPVRQGLFGAFEVFVDTLVVCVLSGLAILTADHGAVWSSGAQGSVLSINAFGSVFGSFGPVFIALTLLLFGTTTQAGWFAYYDVMLNQLFKEKQHAKNIVMTIFKFFYPLPGLFTIWLAVTGGEGPKLTWAIADCISAIPTFINILCMVLIFPTFVKLLDDYRARYLGQGIVDPNFKVFYDTPPIPEDKKAQ